MLQDQERTVVTIKQAGALAGVTRRTINEWIARGKVDVIYTAGGGVRIFVDTLFRTADGRPMKARP